MSKMCLSGALCSMLVMCSAVLGCAESSAFRNLEARPSETIFSPLDLPAANAERTASGAPGASYWQQRADYSIEATLDTDSHVVRAVEHIVYTNNSPDPLEYIWMHLEQNVFRHDSLASKLQPGWLDEATFVGGVEGGLVISSIRVGDEDLEYHVYDTVAQVELPAPIEPGGGRFEFTVSWEFPIVYNIDLRFGIEEVEQGVIFELAQWFPAVAVYDDVHGWNTLPYIGGGEFYTNYGDYDVSLTVPRSHLVGATGVLQNPDEVLTQVQRDRLAKASDSDETVVIRGADEVEDESTRPDGEGPLTWRFKAHNVRTFAWASSDAFLWDAASADGALVQSLYPKEGIEHWTDATQMLRFSIMHYNKMWFHYPYPVATNVNGIEGGMEYPMIIFCSSRDEEKDLFFVTAHEIGHNWFPMTVNTDERRHPWMDEGFNTFINYYAMKARYPEENPFPKSERMSYQTDRVAGAMSMPGQLPIETPPDRLPRWQVGWLEYMKTAYGMRLLREQILGEERFDRAFRTYIRRWAFKSPMPADFFRTMEDAAGEDLAWFWRGWFLETSELDQAVDQIHQDDGAIDVTFSNLGELVMPVVFRVTYDDGSREMRTLPVDIWSHSDRFTTSWEDAREVEMIEIDPDKAFPDVNRKNNSRSD